MKRLLWVLMSLLYMSMMESCQYDNIKHKLSQMYGSKIDLSVLEMMIVMPDGTYADRIFHWLLLSRHVMASVIH